MAIAVGGGLRAGGLLALAAWIGVEGKDALGFHAEAAPRFGDDDAVSGVAGVVADLDGLVNAVAGGAFGQQRDVLGAVVGDAGDAVAVEQKVRCGAGAFSAVEGARVDNAAVGDASVESEVLAAAATYIIRRGWTMTGSAKRWMAAMAIQPARTMRVSALTKAARTPARW